MDLDQTSVVTGLALTAWGVVLAHWFGERKTRNELRRVQASTAANETVAAIRKLQRLVRRHDAYLPLHVDEVGRAVVASGDVEDRNGHRLPEGMGHVPNSVLGAVGTVFGAIAFAHTNPDTGDYRLEGTRSHVGDLRRRLHRLVARVLSRWGDSALQMEFDTYNDWLVVTGRREPPGRNMDDRLV